MSWPRSRSPHYRFLWEEPNFSHHQEASCKSVPSHHREFFGEKVSSGGQRRAPPHPDHHRPLPRPHHSQFNHHRESSYHHDDRYCQRRSSAQRDVWRGADRSREGFRPRPQAFHSKERSSLSPPSTRPYQQRSPEDWRQEEQGRGGCREFNPEGRPEQEQRRRNLKGAAHHDRNATSLKRNTPPLNRNAPLTPPPPPPSPPSVPLLKWSRQEVDGDQQAGFRHEEVFAGQGFSVEPSSGDVRGSSWGPPPHRDLPIQRVRLDSPEMSPARWERFGNGICAEEDFSERRSGGGSVERYRDEGRERRPQYHRRNVAPSLNGTNHGRAPDRDGPMSYKGRGAPCPITNRYNPHPGARTGPSRTGLSRMGLPSSGPSRTQPHFQQFEEVGEEAQARHRPLMDVLVEDSGSDRDSDRNLDPTMPRHRQRGANQKANDKIAAMTEETLTIKVDMSRPARHNSLQSFSSDRQLSLDLVNVGRQRLDFLPTLEHSGSNRETPTHTGTFAQEIITLVHQVKELYSRGDEPTLNQRFTSPQCAHSVEGAGLTLNQRFSSSRGFSLDDDDDSLFYLQGAIQPVRGPGDLRHDLERRRQEKLEGVKVTILGHSTRGGASSRAAFRHRNNRFANRRSNYQDDTVQIGD